MTTDTTLAGSCTGPARDRYNQRRIIAWQLAWVITWLVAFLTIKFGWLAAGPVAIAAAIATTLLGIGQFVAYRRFLREADELRRKIELDAMAFTLWLGVIGGVAYWLLEAGGVVPEANLLYLVTAMFFVYPLGIVIGCRRYA